MNNLPPFYKKQKDHHQNFVLLLEQIVVPIIILNTGKNRKRKKFLEALSRTEELKFFPRRTFVSICWHWAWLSRKKERPIGTLNWLENKGICQIMLGSATIVQFSIKNKQKLRIWDLRFVISSQPISSTLITISLQNNNKLYALWNYMRKIKYVSVYIARFARNV